MAQARKEGKGVTEKMALSAVIGKVCSNLGQEKAKK